MIIKSTGISGFKVGYFESQRALVGFDRGSRIHITSLAWLHPSIVQSNWWVSEWAWQTWVQDSLSQVVCWNIVKVGFDWIKPSISRHFLIWFVQFFFFFFFVEVWLRRWNNAKFSNCSCDLGGECTQSPKPWPCLSMEDALTSCEVWDSHGVICSGIFYLLIPYWMLEAHHQSIPFFIFHTLKWFNSSFSYEIDDTCNTSKQVSWTVEATDSIREVDFQLVIGWSVVRKWF